MFYLIEKVEQLKKLKEFEDCYVKFISFNNNYHPKLNNLSLIYIRGINSHKGYIICHKHSESLSLEWEDIKEFLLNKTKNIFVLNKKESLYYFSHSEKLFDINFIWNPNFSKLENNNCINYFYNKFPNNFETNCLIPIVKHYEEQEQIFQVVKKIIKNGDLTKEIEKYTYKFQNNNLTEVFFKLENEGIQLSKKKFIKHFNKTQYPEYNIKCGKIFTQYNLYTTTGRPSNVFNNINFSSLNKENNERSCFIPENDGFIELDINAYHPRLIGELINYDLPQENLYETLGIEKEEMFQNIYGGIYKNHPFLNEVKKFIEYKWQSEKYGINTKLKYLNWERDKINNPNKLLSYIIQGYETYNNVNIIEKLQEFLKNKKTKLVLYVYDSFLFDYSKKDGELTKELQKIIEYPTKIKTGIDYNKLK